MLYYTYSVVAATVESVIITYYNIIANERRDPVV